MVLLLHISIALASMIYTTYLGLRPSQAKLYVAYGLVTSTLLSGTYLVWTTHAAIMQSCVTGLVYLVAVACGLVTAQYRLAHAQD